MLMILDERGLEVIPSITLGTKIDNVDFVVSIAHSIYVMDDTYRAIIASFNNIIYPKNEDVSEFQWYGDIAKTILLNWNHLYTLS